MPKKSKTFCILPWLGLEVRTGGSMAVCCNSRETLKNALGEELNAATHSLEEARRSPEVMRLRKSLSAGVTDANCDRCWESEKSTGYSSRRQLANYIFAKEIRELESNPRMFEEKPRSLDLKFSNFCNQKCRICGPRSSTLWAKEMAEMFPGDPKFPEVNWGRDNPRLWEEFRDWLPSITRLDLFGGEPFIIPECEKLLSLAVELGVAGQIELRLSTNGSLFPEKYVKRLFPHFKRVNIFLSLDGTGKQFEYQRHPARWKEALEVYRQFRATDYFGGVLLTVSALNVYDLPEYLHFWNEQKEERVVLSTLFNPEFLHVNILPGELKKKVADRLLNISGVPARQKEEALSVMLAMCQTQREDQWPMFLKVTRSHDSFRNEDFRKTFPEYYEAGKEFFTRVFEEEAGAPGRHRDAAHSFGAAPSASGTSKPAR